MRTGAAAQYPLEQTLSFQTEAVRFLDGSQQKYRLYGSVLRRWSIKLDLLDDGELAALTSFLETQGTASFTFTDPITGADVARCVISGDQFKAGSQGEMLSNMQVVIEEIP
ncbi:MAG: hypothetical protein M3N54_04185 [Acidobacteriota bacterium]|nr:hypothetical protein [Acidobacteriota bacterium]